MRLLQQKYAKLINKKCLDYGDTARPGHAKYLAAGQRRSCRLAGPHEECRHPEQGPKARGCRSYQNALSGIYENGRILAGMSGAPPNLQKSLLRASCVEIVV